MKTITTSAHLEPDTTTRVTVFDSTPDGECFVSLRIGGELIDIALPQPGTAGALRALARAAEEAASALDQITETASAGAA
ncbi:hypothetical protein [Streptomyces sp. SID2888]|uniref:hypothetical protein n=1 Tax=Streptomyces sp. SID2888 TaxID=2690256 RepID=UPI00136E8ED8|nr:hypothetical protein [Streptomyces sp. SID2888]MYV46164.1 hypothetical protein [Streptomyces sp. SID2888]